MFGHSIEPYGWVYETEYYNNAEEAFKDMTMRRVSHTLAQWEQHGIEPEDYENHFKWQLVEAAAV